MSDPGEKEYGIGEANYWRYNHQVEPGDKLSNRFGMKGVVSKIQPDDQMPKMQDGTPVELIFNSAGIHSRLTIGQLREAVLGRLARAEGEPIIAPPFHGPSEDDIRQRLAAVGLPSDGSEQLLHGETGEPLPNRSTAGWVYWGRTNHLVQHKLVVSIDSNQGMQRQSEMEFQMLRQLNAKETIREHFQIRAASLPTNLDREAGTLDQKERSTIPSKANSPTALFCNLRDRLAAAGIGMTGHNDGLQFSLQAPAPEHLLEIIDLARPVSHPWLSEHYLESVGEPWPRPSEIFGRHRGKDFVPIAKWTEEINKHRLPEFQLVAQANKKLARLQQGNAPQSLTDKAYNELEDSIRGYFDVLLVPEDVHFDARVNFSGRSVLAPGPGLTHEQMGLPNEMAWILFGSQVAEKLNDEAVASRTDEAAAILDDIMADSWVLVHRVPTLRPTAMIAFRPVRHLDKVIRIPFMACRPMDADFDGDQAAVFLPQTVAGQKEAGELLSLAGHLNRDPHVLDDVAPHRAPMWGLALHSLSDAGLSEIREIAGAAIDVEPGYISRGALIDALRPQLISQGAAHVLAILDRLMRLGFAAIKETGLSLNPFVQLGLEIPDAPPLDRPDLWDVYMQQRAEQLLATQEYGGEWGHYALASKSGALKSNRIRLLAMLLVSRGVITDINGKSVAIPQTFVQGIPPEEHFKTVAGAQAGMRRIVEEWERSSQASPSSGQVHCVYAMSRARRSANPGVVFARAAAMNEIDPLVDEVSRFFVGL